MSEKGVNDLIMHNSSVKSVLSVNMRKYYENIKLGNLFSSISYLEGIKQCPSITFQSSFYDVNYSTVASAICAQGHRLIPDKNIYVAYRYLFWVALFVRVGPTKIKKTRGNSIIRMFS